MIAFFVLITIVDITAALIIFGGALSPRMRLYPTWHKIGLIVGVIGLVAQAFRNIEFLITGQSPTDADLPLWALKDSGIALIAYNYFVLKIQELLKPKPQKRVRKAPAKKPAIRRAK